MKRVLCALFLASSLVYVGCLQDSGGADQVNDALRRPRPDTGSSPRDPTTPPGPSPAPTTPPVPPPTGSASVELYVLDNQSGTSVTCKATGTSVSARDSVVRSRSFLNASGGGHAARFSWAQLNPAKGKYCFEVFDQILAKVRSVGQRFGLTLFTEEPAWVAQSATLPTWTFVDPNENHDNTAPQTRTVPWDPAALQAARDFLQALASYVPSGASTKLADLPEFAFLIPGVVTPGARPFRELGYEYENLPGYSRSTFITGVRQGLTDARAAFPGTPMYLELYQVQDSDKTTPLWEDIRTEADKVSVNSFMENVAVSSSGSAYPTPSDGAGKLCATRPGPCAFEALTAWKQPFPAERAPKVAGATAADGITAMQKSFPGKVGIFRLYAADADDSATASALSGLVPAP